MNWAKKTLYTLYYMCIKRDNAAFARKLGVKVGIGARILGNPTKIFTTEPWLITLGDHVSISRGATFLNHEGGIWVLRGINSELAGYDILKPINVGNNVFIGMNVTIMPGVTIGDNVIIGTSSVVTKDIPSNTIVAGVPAKPISTLERFMEKAKQQSIPTKGMNAAEKYAYCLEHHPEWFNKECNEKG